MNRPREGLEEQDEQHSSERDDKVVGEIDSFESEKRLLQNELARCRELSMFITKLQEEISEIRAVLSKRYWPELEAQIQRLSMERDETLISWGQAILGLCSGEGYVEVHLADHSSLTLFNESSSLSDQSLNHSYRSPLHFHSSEENMIDDGEDRVLGQTTSIFSELQSSQQREEVALQPESDLKEQNVLEDDLDPGINDAPTLSLTQFSLKELREQILQPKGWIEGESKDEQKAEVNSREQAIELIKRLGTPRELSAHQLKEQLIELESEVDCCQSWSEFEQEVQHAVVTLVTSRLRAIQDQIGESPFDQDRIAKMFRRLTRFSSDFRPGFIHGLSREKVPEFDSWRNDEIHAWKRLEKQLGLEQSLPKLSPERAEKIEHLKDILSREEEISDFSNVLRAAVTDCLNSGFSQESPHLVMVLESHLSHLSGKRFKKLRLAASAPRF
jgi:hypothetical protein